MRLLPRPKEAAQRGQAPVRHGRPALLALLAALAGCGPVERFYDSKLTPDTPIEWWQDLQGGRIASARPPPPGVGDPYPNLADVPARPVLPDQATRRALQARLTAERERTRRDGEQDPIGTVPVPAPVAPVAVKAPPDPEASVAVFDGATAAPGRAAPARPAPSAPIAALQPAASTAMPAGVAPPRPESGPLPDLPIAAPGIPLLGGIPAGTFGAAAPPPSPSVEIRFPRGSASLPDTASPALRSLAQRRGSGPVLIVAGGGAVPGAADQQAAALTMALRRARAIAQSLVEAGVPAAALRYDVSAPGNIAGARLLEL